MMPRRVGVVIVVAAVLWAAPAWAQSTSNEGFRGRLFVHFEGQAMTAKDSFDAVTGTSSLSGLGAGVEAQQLWRGLFVRGALSRLKKTGERIFVSDGEVFRLGVPLEITMMPLELGAGWRFTSLSGLVPYVGVGALFLKHREETPGDASGEGVNETYTGVALFGGVEVPVWRYVSAGAEVGWRKATVASPGGAMAAFGEKDLGGVTFRVMLSIKN